MSSSTVTGEASSTSINNPYATTQQRQNPTGAAGQSRLGQQHQEVSRWSPNTSSPGMSDAGAQRSTEETVDSTAAAHGSTTARDTFTNAGSVEAERERARFALEHGGQRAPESERNAEGLSSRVTQNPEAAQVVSSSGSAAQERRSRRR